MTFSMVWADAQRVALSRPRPRAEIHAACLPTLKQPENAQRLKEPGGTIVKC